MRIEGQLVRSVSWLALFKTLTQVSSWLVTILVARLLLPEDYGLMAMATIITGYAEIFSELGLGAAIIQRSDLKIKDLSSIFWFVMVVSCLFCLFSFTVAPVTAHLFNEPRVLPLTQAVSVIFIISGLQIVPLNLLKKELNFKSVGFIEMVGSMVACGSMLILAYNGAGVWTLLGGRIINGVVRVLMLYNRASWRPIIYFDFKGAVSYIRFGVVVAVSHSFYYLFEKSDKFFAGRVWSPQLVGYYSFAQQLALIPTEKIVSLINQVSFTAFAQLQDDKKEFNKLYLKIVGFTSTIVFPLYVGGFILAEELIVLLIGQQWLLAVFLFKFLCLAQIPRSLNAINNFVHISRGEPQLGLFINIVLAITMSISFYYAVQNGLHAIVVPWLTTYTLICCGWIVFTVRKIGVTLSAYFTYLFHPAMATIIMFLTVVIIKSYLYGMATIPNCRFVVLLSSVGFGCFVYVSYFFLFDRGVFRMMKDLRKG